MKSSRVTAVLVGCMISLLGACDVQSGKAARAVAPEEVVSAGEDAEAPELTPLSARQVVDRSLAAVVRIETPHGGGSGYVVRADGIVATAYHVIHAERQARVILRDGRVIPIERVLVADRDHDLALVAVGGADLPYLELGDSDGVALGDPVVTIGHAFGLPEQTVTNGLISSVRRDDDAELIQVSTPVSRGTSGGPVLDDAGHVVGTISLMVEGGQNVNFAIPSNELRRLMGQLEAFGGEQGESMTAFGERTRGGADEAVAPAPVRIDHGALSSCSESSRTKIAEELMTAIQVAAPLLAFGAPEATFRVLEGGTLRLARDLEDCSALVDALSTAMIDAGQRETPAEAVLVADQAFQATLELLFESDAD